MERATQADILPFVSPEPISPDVTWVCRSSNSGGWTSAVARKWPDGTTPALCGRCPIQECCLTDGVCLIVVNGFVADSLAPEFGRPEPTDHSHGANLRGGRWGRDEAR